MKLYGKEPLLKRTGGSVNAFADFKKDLNLESYSFGFGDMDGYIHAPVRHNYDLFYRIIDGMSAK